jgi:hypothetical protein
MMDLALFLFFNMSLRRRENEKEIQTNNFYFMISHGSQSIDHLLGTNLAYMM